jgi:hypothetical protein
MLACWEVAGGRAWVLCRHKVSALRKVPAWRKVSAWLGERGISPGAGAGGVGGGSNMPSSPSLFLLLGSPSRPGLSCSLQLQCPTWF